MQTCVCGFIEHVFSLFWAVMSRMQHRKKQLSAKLLRHASIRQAVWITVRTRERTAAEHGRSSYYRWLPKFDIYFNDAARAVRVSPSWVSRWKEMLGGVYRCIRGAHTRQGLLFLLWSVRKRFMPWSHKVACFVCVCLSVCVCVCVCVCMFASNDPCRSVSVYYDWWRCQVVPAADANIYQTPIFI